MAPMIIAGYSLVTVLALSDGAVFGESYLQQAPATNTNPAFVEQLPETSVVPAIQPPTNSRTSPHKSKQPPRARPHTLLANSVFPSVGSGVTERAAPGPLDNRLPTVGAGTVGH
ncbi:MAG: hypothetical protein QM684_03180 [Rhizobium sp.]|uniref:hypothetical protein n=1 Tax=Rhizobium sp. SYY.PMSO TaxID=3382192 RepID=UPI0013AF4AF0